MWNKSFAVFVVTLSATMSASIGRAQQPSPLELFDQRIMPIFRSPQPSSCVQCHLSAVDLKNYILPSHAQTFVSLRDQGLIDLEFPDKSKILTLIQMGDKDLDQGARLIHENTRTAEYEAFAAWIKACCVNLEMRMLPKLSAAEQARPDKPDAVIRHARKSRVVDSFIRIVWSQRLRCFPCHTPHEIDAANPRHQAAIKKQKEFKQQHGEELVARLRIFRETPEATMQYLIQSSRATPKSSIPLIDLEDPRKSLIIRKPMSKPPRKNEAGEFEPAPSVEPITHMGGLKMHPDDQTYKSFIAWIQDYANVVGDRYASVEDLPADNWFASKLVLKVKSTPADWTVGTPVQLFVHAWNDQADSWEPNPIAFTQGTVTPRGMVNGTLFLLASHDRETIAVWDREGATLARGRYLVKAFVDSNHRLADDPTLLLGEEDFFGQIELKKARWREGFRRAESISGAHLKK